MVPGPAGAGPGRAERPRPAHGPPLRARHLHVEPGDHRRDVREQLGRLPLDRLRQDAGPRPRADLPPGRRLGGRAPRPHARPAGGEEPGRRPGGADLPGGAAARGRPRRRDPGALSPDHAAGLRLQPRRVPQVPAVRPPPPGGRLRGHAGGRGRDEDAARAEAEAHRARRDPLRDARGGAGIVARPPDHRPLRRRADGQDDPRPGPRQLRAASSGWASSRATRPRS